MNDTECCEIDLPSQTHKKVDMLESYKNIRILNGLRVLWYYTNILSEEILSICNSYWFLNGIIWSRLRFTDFH